MRVLSRISCAPILLFVIIFWGLEACRKKVDDAAPTAPQPKSTPDTIAEGATFVVPAGYVFTNKPGYYIDYVVKGKIIIWEGVATVEPGTRFVFCHEDAGVLVTESGGFHAVGTADAPIVFEGCNRHPGAWLGIIFGSDNDQNKLSHCIIKHAGSKPDVMMANVRAAVGVSTHGDPDRYNRVWMSFCQVDSNAGYGAYIASRKGYFTEFYGNSFQANTWAPLGLPFNAAVFLKPENSLNNDSLPNYQPYIYLTTIGFNQGSDFSYPGTIPRMSLPYRVQGWKGPLIITSHCTVAPGVIFEMEENSGIVVKSGFLRAQGTPGQYIFFKGAPGGQGVWNGLAFQSNSFNNILQYCYVDGGGGAKLPWTDGQANVVVGSWFEPGNLSMSYCRIQSSQAWGVARRATSALGIENCEFYFNAFSPDIYIYGN
ncbi:MAG: hypothetical protein N2050_05675 [Flavobacteriales bacterium]|nr:hypothetical protein [Flavobacteriales bacterium]